MLNMSIFGNGTAPEIITQCSKIQTAPTLWGFVIIISLLVLILGLLFFNNKENRKRVFWLFLLIVLFASIIAFGIQTIPNTWNDLMNSVISIFTRS